MRGPSGTWSRLENTLCFPLLVGESLREEGRLCSLPRGSQLGSFVAVTLLKSEAGRPVPPNQLPGASPAPSIVQRPALVTLGSQRNLPEGDLALPGHCLFSEEPSWGSERARQLAPCAPSRSCRVASLRKTCRATARACQPPAARPRLPTAATSRASSGVPTPALRSSPRQ